MRIRKKSSGFTLVELTMVVVVAGVALTATAGAVTSGARLARTTAETRAAMRSAQSMMERVRATPFNDVATTFAGANYALSTVCGGDSSGTCSVAVTPLSNGSSRWRVLKVDVTTRWKGTAGDASQTMSTYVCDRADASALSTSRTTVAAP